MKYPKDVQKILMTKDESNLQQENLNYDLRKVGN